MRWLRLAARCLYPYVYIGADVGTPRTALLAPLIRNAEPRPLGPFLEYRGHRYPVRHQRSVASDWDDSLEEI